MLILFIFQSFFGNKNISKMIKEKWNDIMASCFLDLLKLGKCIECNVLHNYNVPEIPLDTTYINCKAI